MKSQFYFSFWRANLISCERVGEPGNRNVTTVFGDRTSCRAKGFAGQLANRNFTSVFGDRTSFRAKGLRREPGNRNLTSVLPQQRKLTGSSAQNSSGVDWCRRRVRFNDVPEKVPKVPEKGMGGFGAEPGQVQQGSECRARSGSTGFRRRFR